jgi:hypothetical protein
VPYVPVGRKPVSSSTVPSSAPNSSSAFGLAIVKFVSASAPRNDVEALVRLSTTVNSSVASQLS